MFQAAFRGSVRETGSSVLLQRHTLYLHKIERSVLLKGEIKAGISEFNLTLKMTDRAEAAACQPFIGSLVGGLGVHINKKRLAGETGTLFIDTDERILGLSTFFQSVGVMFENQLGAWKQEFPASPGIFNVADNGNAGI